MIKHAPIAQQIEQSRPKGKVAGAIPARGARRSIQKIPRSGVSAYAESYCGSSKYANGRIGWKNPPEGAKII